MSCIKTETPPGVFAHLDSILLNEVPVRTSWILSGRPRARSGRHSASQDGNASTHVWDCTQGAFKWHFGWDETVLILEGGVKVTSPAGEVISLEVGDMAHFPAGTTWTWEIEHYVRKLAFCRRPASRMERLLAAVRTRLQTHSAAIRMGLGIATAAAASVAAFSAFE